MELKPQRIDAQKCFLLIVGTALASASLFAVYVLAYFLYTKGV